jgi:hypothetical protein
VELPKNIEFVDVKVSEGWITQVDTPDLSERFLMDIVGFKNDAQGMIGQRDWGTIHRKPAYPTVPAAATIKNGFTFIDRTDSTEYEVILDAATYMRLYVHDPSMAGANPGTVNDWIELTRVFTAKVNEPSGIGASDKNVDIGTVKDSLTNSYSLATNELRYYICLNVTRNPNQAVFITASSATNISCDTVLGSAGLGWAHNDNLVFFKHNGWFDALFVSPFPANPAITDINYNIGATPHFAVNSIDAQRKANIYYGTAPYTASMKTPLQLQRQNTRTIFKAQGGGKLVTLPANWYLEKGGGGLCPFYASLGSVNGPVSSYPLTAFAQNIEDSAGNAFLRIEGRYGSPSTGSPQQYSQLRFAVTLVYNGYEESDPVFKAFVKVDDPSRIYPDFYLDNLRINLARMNKSITGIRLYATAATQGQVDAGWADADADYIFLGEINFSDATIAEGANSGVYWSVSNTVPEMPYTWNFSGGFHILQGQVFFNGYDRAKNGGISLRAKLAHASQTVRAYRKPRFARQLSRNQTSIIVADDGDLALVTSSYNGDPNHEDDNFPNATVDINNNPMRYVLTGHGEMYGLETMGENAVIFRPTEIEIVGMESGARRIIPADVESRRSIIRFPGGIAWAGRSSIYLLPEGGGEVENLIPNIQNWYDGTMIATGTTPFVADADRKNIIGGWNETDQELWFQVKTTSEAGATEWVQLRIPRRTGKPYKRIIDNGFAGELKYYSNSLDKSFTLGQQNGILKYPNRSGNFYFQDNVDLLIDDPTNNIYGIIGRLAINIGSVYDLMQNAVLFCIILDYEGDDMTGTEKFDLKLYANGSTTPFDSKKYYVRKLKHVPDEPRPIEPYGQIQQLKVEILLPVATRQKVKKFNLSTIKLGFLRQTRIGTN